MRKNRLTNFLLVLMFLAGLSLLLYPSFSNYWNELHSSKAIYNYSQQVSKIDHELYDKMLQQAHDYNAALLSRENPYLLTAEMQQQYESLLSPDGSGAMGFIEIPSIDCSAPIYHYTYDTVLQKAIGHIHWSSLPVGGTGSHSVLSGHRGLPSAKLFTDMDKLQEGDLFHLHVLNEVLSYQVDQILIVEPRDTEALLIDPEADYCTLVTCTPYGINTHRMLVRGVRVETEEKVIVNVTSDAVQIEPLIVAAVLAVPILLVFLIWIYIPKTKKVHYRGDYHDPFV